MATKNFEELLQERRLDLIGKIEEYKKALNAIDILLKLDDINITSLAGDISKNINQVNESYNSYEQRLGPKSNSITWEDYLYDAVKVLKRGKVADIVKLVYEENNRKLDWERIKSAAGNKLRVLVAENKIGVEPSESKKLGYTYYIKE